MLADAAALARLTPKKGAAGPGLDATTALATFEKSFQDTMQLFELDGVDPFALFDELAARQKEEEEFLGRAPSKRASITFGTFCDGFLASVGMESMEALNEGSPLRAAQVLQALEFIFGKLDADSDGRVSQRELCAGISSFFTRNPKQTAAAIFAMYDADGSGVVDDDEMSAFLRAMLGTAVHADERCVTLLCAARRWWRLRRLARPSAAAPRTPLSHARQKQRRPLILASSSPSDSPPHPQRSFATLVETRSLDELAESMSASLFESVAHDGGGITREVFMEWYVGVQQRGFDHQRQ